MISSKIFFQTANQGIKIKSYFVKCITYLKFYFSNETKVKNISSKITNTAQLLMSLILTL